MIVHYYLTNSTVRTLARSSQAPAWLIFVSPPSFQLHRKWYIINKHIYLPANPNGWIQMDEIKSLTPILSFSSFPLLIIYCRRKIALQKWIFTTCSINSRCISLILCPSTNIPLSRLILNSAQGWAPDLSNDKFLTISPQIFYFVCQVVNFKLAL